MHVKCTSPSYICTVYALYSLTSGDGRVPLPLSDGFLRCGAAQLRLLPADRVHAGRRHQGAHGHAQDAAHRRGALLYFDYVIHAYYICTVYALCMHCVYVLCIHCICTVQARFYFACVMSAVDEMHAKDWMHRDLKMENIMIGQNGYAKALSEWVL